jgi:hypothetical protein
LTVQAPYGPLKTQLIEQTLETIEGRMNSV